VERWRSEPSTEQSDAKRRKLTTAGPWAPGGTVGSAVERQAPEMFAEAELEYRKIRKPRDGLDAEWKTIARRVAAALPEMVRLVRDGAKLNVTDEPLTATDIRQVWEHLFRDEHILDDKVKKARWFDAHPLIAKAYYRLRGDVGYGEIQPSDVGL